MIHQTDELLLLTYSEYLSGHHLDQLVEALRMMVIGIDGTFYMIDSDSLRIDEAERTIYGRGNEIQTYGEYH